MAKRKRAATPQALTTTPGLNRDKVRFDVGMAIRDVVIHRTPFSIETYSGSLVPQKNPPKGWEASTGHWGFILGLAVGQIRAEQAEYKVLSLTPDDVEKTLSEPLSDTAELLTDKIMKGVGAVTGAS